LQFGLRYRLPDDLIAVYKSFGNDLTIGNGEDSWTLPMPARYVIGTDCIIAYAEVNPDYTRRPDPSELFAGAAAPSDRRCGMNRRTLRQQTVNGRAAAISS
jgi:hypothetical protein